MEDNEEPTEQAPVVRFARDPCLDEISMDSYHRQVEEHEAEGDNAATINIEEENTDTQHEEDSVTQYVDGPHKLFLPGASWGASL